MAQNKPVNKLPIVDNPSITGYTIYEDGIRTSITSIDSIRNIINENIVIPISGVTGLGVILTGLTENKLDKNPAIPSRVRTKITYDTSGLVISGDTLTKDDIPLLDYYSLTGGTLLNEQITGLTNSFNTHTGNTLNPHNVTATQIGVYTSGRTDELLLTKSDTGHTHPGVYLPITGGTLNGYLTSFNISGTSLNTGDERYTNTIPTPTTIFGVNSGSTFNNNTMKEMFDLLLYPELFPSVLGITNTFTISLNSLYEIGSVVAGTTTASFNRGSITPAYGTDGFRSGPPIQYNYTGSGITTTVSSATSNVQSITGLTISTGNTSWTSTVTYSAGQQPLSSKGNPHPLYSALVSGTTSPVITKTVEGVYPIFATTSSITGLTKQPLVTMLNSSSLTGITLSLVSETDGNKQKFELPAGWVGFPTNKPLVGIEVFNTNSNKFAYFGDSAVQSLTLWTVTDVTETVQGNTVGYKRYTFNGADRGPVILNLKFQ